jgi:hypothetical protein
VLREYDIDPQMFALASSSARKTLPGVVLASPHSLVKTGVPRHHTVALYNSTFYDLLKYTVQY